MISGETYAQSSSRSASELINTTFHNKPLAEVLGYLETHHQVYFAYSDELVRNRLITVKLIQVSYQQALERIFQSTDITFEIVRPKHVLLKRRKLIHPVSYTPPAVKCRVVDASTGQPLSFATLVCDYKQRGALADETGAVLIENHFSDLDSLTISHLGYKPRKVNVAYIRKRSQTLGKHETLLITLTPKPAFFEDVLITDRITLLDLNPKEDNISIRPGSMRSLPGWGEPDIYRMMELLPGINSSEGNPGGINIKGGTAGQNLVLWDEIPIYHQSHFFGLFAPFNPYAVDRLDIYANGFGASKGGRVSSIIDLQAKPDTVDKLNLGFGANLLHTYAFAELPHFDNKATLFISGRRAFSDIVASSFFNRWFNYTFQERIEVDQQENLQQGGVFNLIPQFFYQDITAKWLFQPSPRDRLQVSFYQGKDQLDYWQNDLSPLPENEDMELESRDLLMQANWGLSSSWLHTWNASHTTEASLVYSDYIQRWNYFYEERLPEFKIHRAVHQSNTFDDLTLKFHHNWSPVSMYKLEVGAQWIQQRAGLHYQDNYLEALARSDTLFNIDSSQQNFQGFMSAFYMENHINLTQDLYINTGVRLTHVSHKEQMFVEPRLAISYSPTSKLSLQFRWGIYRQFANQVFFENELRVGENFWLINSHPDQPHLKATHISIGGVYQNEQIKFTVDAYHKALEGLLSNAFEFKREVRDLSDLDINHFDWESNSALPFVVGTGTAKGIDLWLQYRRSIYTSWLGYSLSSVTYQFPDFNQGEPFPASHDQRHTLKWTHFISLNNWNFSANWLYHTGIPFSNINFERNEEVVESTSTSPNEPSSTANTSYTLSIPEYNGERFAPYHRLDISGSKSFFWGKKRPWQGKIGVSIYNIYNRVNIQRKRYVSMRDADGNLSVIESNNVNPGLTPNIFFQISW